MRWLPALLPLVALFALAHGASAARTDTVVTTFTDAHTMEILTEVVATDGEARAIRDAMDLNRNGVVDGLDLEWDAQCGYSLQPRHVRITMDSYAMEPTFVACDHESARGTVASDAEVRIRKTQRAVSPLAETRTIYVTTERALAISLGAPPGKEILVTGASLVPVGTSRVAGQIGPAAIGHGILLRFPYEGQPLDFGNLITDEATLTMTEPNAIRWEQDRVYAGLAAQVIRAGLDDDRDGVVEPAEVQASIDEYTADGAAAGSITIDGTPVRGRIVSMAYPGAVGDAGYAGTVSVAPVMEFVHDLPRGGFRIEGVSFNGLLVFRAPLGRTIEATSGLEAGGIVDDGRRAYGTAATPGTVSITLSASSFAAPAAGATEPEPMAAGAFTRTTAVSVTDGEPALMRWSILDVRTHATARDFRASLDPDADNQVSADEAASHLASLRLVPAPAAWPFTLDGAAPLATRVYAVEDTGLQGAYNDPADVRILVTYEADYARSTGLLRAAPLAYGDALGVSAPHGTPLDAAGATGLASVVAGLDGSTLQAVPDEAGWSVRMGAAPAAPTPAAGDAPPACAAPADAGSLATTWTVTFSAPERAGVRIDQVATGARAASSRAVVDADRDCVVTQAEADAAAAAQRQASLLLPLARLEGASPSDLGSALASLDGYVGAANRADEARFSRSFVATFDGAPPAELELAAQGARVVVVAPEGHRLEAIEGLAATRLSDDGGRLEGDAEPDAARVRVRLVPAAVAAPTQTPPVAPEEVVVLPGVAPAEETAASDEAPAPSGSADAPAAPAPGDAPATGGGVAAPTAATGASPETRPASTPSATPTPEGAPAGAAATPSRDTPLPPLVVLLGVGALAALARRR